MSPSQAVQDRLLSRIASNLPQLGGQWRREGPGLVSPGSAAVLLNWSFNTVIPNRLDFGFGPDIESRPDVIIWDYAVGIGRTPVQVLENAVDIWLANTAPVLLELVTMDGRHATHVAPGASDGIEGYHVIHGAPLAYGIGNTRKMIAWAQQNPLLPRIADHILPHLTGAENAIKMVFGGRKGNETAEVRVNDEPIPQASATLATADWPRLRRQTYARIFAVTHRAN